MEIETFSHYLKLRESIDQLRLCQDKHEQSLRSFIQQELESLKASILPAGVFEHPKSGVLATDGCIKPVLDNNNSLVAVNEPELPDRPSGPNGSEKLHEPGDDDDNEHLRMLELHRKHTTQIWRDFLRPVDEHVSYKRLTDTIRAGSEGFWHQVFRYFGCGHMLRDEMPANCLAKITQHHLFATWQTLLILSNAGIMGYEADAEMNAVLQDPPGEVPAWIQQCNLVYNILFTVELLFRLVALRSWFWVSPEDWGWNVFDVFVVFFSLITDVFGGINLSFLRTFRILRAVRAVRLIRVLRMFTELRKMLFAMLACISSLLWCFIFLSMMIFMFSVLILQGIADALSAMEPSSHERVQACDLAREWYGSLGKSMFTLLAIFTAGSDFYTFLKPISPAGFLYSLAFVLYTLFVIVGVMNVLTGVFLASAENFADRSLIVHNEKINQETFVRQMLEVFEELDLDKDGDLTWDEFSCALRNENLQAYLAAHEFDVTHAQLTYDVLDHDGDGHVSLIQFVMGMLRLKGKAKAIDARVIQRELNLVLELWRHTLKSKAHHASPPCKTDL